jgi:hypothetical protein
MSRQKFLLFLFTDNAKYNKNPVQYFQIYLFHNILNTAIFIKVIDITGDTIYQLAGDWGVRFGSVLQGSKLVYNRIELVRKGMVVEYLTK